MPPVAKSTRVGKVASLPAEIRDELNRRMLNGELSPQVLPWLNGLPEVKTILTERFEGVAVSIENLSAWRKGGFREWLNSAERVKHTQAMAGYAAKLARANGGRLAEGAQAIAGGRILEILEATGGKVDLESLEKIVNALNGLRAQEIAQQRADQDRVKLNQNEQVLKLDREKFELLICNKLLDVAKLAKVREIAESGMDNAAKIQALRQEYFSDVDALEASGAVKLPEK